MRKAFIETLCAIAEERDDVMLLCGDLGFSVLEVFAERFPARYVNMGIAEQNMAGVAAGLAMTGKTVITYSIANFALLRCLEQLRNDVCYHNLPVITVSVGSGGAYGTQGYTHHGIEDMAFTRLLPNMAVVSPGDARETAWALRALVERGGPASLRLGRGGEPLVHQAPITAKFGTAIRLRPVGRDATLLATGAVLPEAVAAAEHLAAQGLDVGLYSMPSVEPLDHEAILAAAQGSALLVTAEEHVVEGGFGGAVAEIIAGLAAPRARLIRAGFRRNGPKLAADQMELRRLHGVDKAGLMAKIVAARGDAAS